MKRLRGKLEEGARASAAVRRPAPDHRACAHLDTGSFRTPTAWTGAARTLCSVKSLPARVFRYVNRVHPDHPPVATLQLPSPPHSHRGLGACRRRGGKGARFVPHPARYQPLLSPPPTHAPAGPGRGRGGAATSRGAEREWGRGPLCAAGEVGASVAASSPEGREDGQRGETGLSLALAGTRGPGQCSTCRQLLRTSAKGSPASAQHSATGGACPEVTPPARGPLVSQQR